MVKTIKGLPKVVTANNLANGLAVFLKSDGTWSLVLSDAEIAGNEEDADALLKKGEVSESTNEVVAPYLIDVRSEGGAVEAVHIREHMRATGPSVRKDLWKQG